MLPLHSQCRQGERNLQPHPSDVGISFSTYTACWLYFRTPYPASTANLIFKSSNNANDRVQSRPSFLPALFSPPPLTPNCPLATSQMAVSTRGRGREGKQLETNTWSYSNSASLGVHTTGQVDKVGSRHKNKKEAVTGGSDKIIPRYVSFIHHAHRLFTVDRISQAQKSETAATPRILKTLSQSKSKAFWKIK